MGTNKIGIKTLVISIAAIVLIEAIAGLIISETKCIPVLIIGTTRLLEIISMILIVLIWRKGISSIGLAPAKNVQGIKRGLVWSAGFAAVTFFVFVCLLILGISPLKLIKIHMPTSQKDILLLFLIGGLIGPIAEEIFFRGIIFGFLRRWGVLIALIFSTFLFVLAHPSPSGVPIIQAVGGIIFAIAYEVEGSLMVPITIHVLGNMAIFCLSF